MSEIEKTSDTLNEMNMIPDSSPSAKQRWFSVSSVLSIGALVAAVFVWGGVLGG